MLNPAGEATAMCRLVLASGYGAHVFHQTDMIDERDGINGAARAQSLLADLCVRRGFGIYGQGGVSGNVRDTWRGCLSLRCRPKMRERGRLKQNR